MMTIDAAIAHAREVAEKNRKCAKECEECSNRKLDKLMRLDKIHQRDRKYYVKSAEEHEQLAEWLELLKWYQQEMEDISTESGVFPKDVYRAGYNKAVDEYMNLLCDHCMQQKNECRILECPFCTNGCDIVNIAQQLKAGGVDE